MLTFAKVLLRAKEPGFTATVPPQATRTQGFPSLEGRSMTSGEQGMPMCHSCVTSKGTAPPAEADTPEVVAPPPAPAAEARAAAEEAEAEAEDPPPWPPPPPSLG